MIGLLLLYLVLRSKTLWVILGVGLVVGIVAGHPWILAVFAGVAIPFLMIAYAAHREREQKRLALMNNDFRHQTDALRTKLQGKSLHWTN